MYGRKVINVRFIRREIDRLGQRTKKEDEDEAYVRIVSAIATKLSGLLAYI